MALYSHTVGVCHDRYVLSQVTTPAQEGVSHPQLEIYILVALHATDLVKFLHVQLNQVVVQATVQERVPTSPHNQSVGAVVNSLPFEVPHCGACTIHLLVHEIYPASHVH